MRAVNWRTFQSKMIQQKVDGVCLVDLVKLLLLPSFRVLLHALDDLKVVLDEILDQDASQRSDALVDRVGDVRVICLAISYLWLEFSSLRKAPICPSSEKSVPELYLKDGTLQLVQRLFGALPATHWPLTILASDPTIN